MATEVLGSTVEHTPNPAVSVPYRCKVHGYIRPVRVLMAGYSWLDCQRCLESWWNSEYAASEAVVGG